MKKKKTSCDYELMYLLNKEYKDFKQLETKILDWLEIKTWKYQDLGEKKIAYPIKKQEIGRYILANFTCTRDKIPFLKEKLRWVPEILRYLVVNLSEEKRFRHPAYTKKNKIKPSSSSATTKKPEKDLTPIDTKLKKTEKKETKTTKPKDK